MEGQGHRKQYHHRLDADGPRADGGQDEAHQIDHNGHQEHFGAAKPGQLFGCLVQGPIFLEQGKEEHGPQQGQEQFSRKTPVQFPHRQVPQFPQDQHGPQADQPHIGFFHEPQGNGSEQKHQCNK